MKTIYNTKGQPNTDEIVTEEWRNFPVGRFCIFGDSNGHYLNVKKIHTECYNDALGGSKPLYALSRINYWREHGKEFDGVYIQTGGNRWGESWSDSVIVDVQNYIDEMDLIISKAYGISSKVRPIIASLPYVSPDLTVGDWPDTQKYPEHLREMLCRINANDIFELANHELEKLCEKYDVIYYDVFNRLKMFWKAGYRNRIFYGTQKYWWDKVHYGSAIREIIISDIRRMWGIV